MKALVTVKRVVDYNVKVRVKSDNSDVDIANVKMSMNPFDEIALEEAIKLKESGKVSEVIAVTIGDDKCEETLRTALAMGADTAIHIATNVQMQPLAVSKLLEKIVQEQKPDLIIMGKQAIDDDFNQTGQMLAALTGYPQATFASKVELLDGKAVIVREVDAGLETIEVNLPCIITADLRLNQPRYATLPNIMKARSKPIDKRQADEFGVDIEPRIKILKVEEPSVREAGIKVESVDELVEKLKKEGVL